MSVILFIVILAVLIVVHEFGHFIVAKKSGIKVTEFGLGFPPKVASVQKGETLYTLNAIPFGGFVKIFGEDPDEASINGPEADRSIISKPRIVQAAVLVAGVTFNALFAWLLFSLGFMIGMPTSVDHTGPGVVMNPHVVITSILPDSPASLADLKSGDKVLLLESGNDSASTLTPESVSDFVTAHASSPITFHTKRGSKDLTVSVTPQSGLTDKPAVGIGMDEIGVVRLPLGSAIVEGLKNTGTTLASVVSGLWLFFRDIFVGHPDLSEVSGPVGIIGLVGDVSKLGLIYVFSFTALISLNLAVINLLPFPALDGGRLVIIAIEGILKRRLNEKFVNTLNTVGFAILIILMVVVTIHDVIKIV